MIHSWNLYVIIIFFWYFHICNILLLFWCCHSWNVLLMVWWCNPAISGWLSDFLHSCEIFGNVFVFVTRGVAICDGIHKAVKEIKSSNLVVSVSKHVYAVDNTCRDGERGESTSFNMVSCTEVEEPLGPLEVSFWSEKYSVFCVGLRGVLWEVFSVWFGLCIEFGFVVFIKVNGGACNYSSRRDRTGHATIYWEHVEAKHCVFQHAGVFLFCFGKLTSSIYWGISSLQF